MPNHLTSIFETTNDIRVTDIKDLDLEALLPETYSVRTIHVEKSLDHNSQQIIVSIKHNKYALMIVIFEDCNWTHYILFFSTIFFLVEYCRWKSFKNCLLLSYWCIRFTKMLFILKSPNLFLWYWPQLTYSQH